MTIKNREEGYNLENRIGNIHAKEGEGIFLRFGLRRLSSRVISLTLRDAGLPLS